MTTFLARIPALTHAQIFMARRVLTHEQIRQITTGTTLDLSPRAPRGFTYSILSAVVTARNIAGAFVPYTGIDVLNSGIYVQSGSGDLSGIINNDFNSLLTYEFTFPATGTMTPGVHLTDDLVSYTPVSGQADLSRAMYIGGWNGDTNLALGGGHVNNRLIVSATVSLVEF